MTIHLASEMGSKIWQKMKDVELERDYLKTSGENKKILLMVVFRIRKDVKQMFYFIKSRKGELKGGRPELRSMRRKYFDEFLDLRDDEEVNLSCLRNSNLEIS